jgi:16S rRNA A1518/A1519 N6-dimethyltransferase RsmA/KsgA/DIM1 with predicted DNA glycosylase/AP lyase activity
MQAKFERWPQSQYDAFLEFAKRCFAQKRKNLLNNLGGIYPRAQIGKSLEGAGKPANSRAEQLSVEDLARLFEALGHFASGAKAPPRSAAGLKPRPSSQ